MHHQHHQRTVGRPSPRLTTGQPSTQQRRQPTIPAHRMQQQQQQQQPHPPPPPPPMMTPTRLSLTDQILSTPTTSLLNRLEAAVLIPSPQIAPFQRDTSSTIRSALVLPATLPDLRDPITDESVTDETIVLLPLPSDVITHYSSTKATTITSVEMSTPMEHVTSIPVMHSPTITAAMTSEDAPIERELKPKIKQSPKTTRTTPTAIEPSLPTSAAKLNTPTTAVAPSSATTAAISPPTASSSPSADVVGVIDEPWETSSRRSTPTQLPTTTTEPLVRVSPKILQMAEEAEAKEGGTIKQEGMDESNSENDSNTASSVRSSTPQHDQVGRRGRGRGRGRPKKSTKKKTPTRSTTTDEPVDTRNVENAITVPLTNVHSIDLTDESVARISKAAMKLSTKLRESKFKCVVQIIVRPDHTRERLVDFKSLLKAIQIKTRSDIQHLTKTWDNSVVEYREEGHANSAEFEYQYFILPGSSRPVKFLNEDAVVSFIEEMKGWLKNERHKRRALYIMAENILGLRDLIFQSDLSSVEEEEADEDAVVIVRTENKSRKKTLRSAYRATLVKQEEEKDSRMETDEDLPSASSATADVQPAAAAASASLPPVSRKRKRELDEVRVHELHDERKVSGVDEEEEIDMTRSHQHHPPQVNPSVGGSLMEELDAALTQVHMWVTKARELFDRQRIQMAGGAIN